MSSYYPRIYAIRVESKVCLHLIKAPWEGKTIFPKTNFNLLTMTLAMVLCTPSTRPTGTNSLMPIALAFFGIISIKVVQGQITSMWKSWKTLFKSSFTTSQRAWKKAMEQSSNHVALSLSPFISFTTTWTSFSAMGLSREFAFPSPNASKVKPTWISNLSVEYYVITDL